MGYFTTLFLLLTSGPLWIITLLFGIRHFLHMLQLSSYQFPGYFRYLRRTFRREWLPLLVSGILYVIAYLHFQGKDHSGLFPGGNGDWFFLEDAAMCVVSAVLLALCIFRFFPRREKKKFVATPRVCRMILTMLLLLCVMAAVYWVTHNFKRELIIYAYVWLPSLWVAPVTCLPLFVALANLINMPWEKHINNGFINDAVRILKEQPRLRIIGVTGSYGKTSVKYYLTTILSEQFDVLMTPESYNTPMGIVRTIREQMKPTHEMFVCEMGARHVGDIKEITDFVHPDDGMVTAIGEQHMETFFTQENIVKTKFELLDAVEEKYPENREQKAGTVPGAARQGCKFVNGDNNLIRANLNYPDAITYGLEEGNDFRAIDLKVTGAGTSFKIRLSERIARRLAEEQGYAVKAPVRTDHETDVPAKTPDAAQGAPGGMSGMEFHTVLVGAHNIQNITGAIAVAVMYGIPASKIRMGVRRIAPVPHRLEVKKHGNVTILDDAFNSNPAGAKAALDTLAMFEDTVKILVTPGMVELGSREDECNATFGAQAAPVCDYIILVGEKQTQALKTGILGAGFDPERLFVKADFNEASRLMYELDAGREKVILLENDLPDNY